MIRLDHRQPIPEALRGAILALGNFDGFHRGHQAVVGEALAWARAKGTCIHAQGRPATGQSERERSPAARLGYLNVKASPPRQATPVGSY